MMIQTEHAKGELNAIRVGQKLYTGAIATPQFAAAYNRLTRQILDFERAGRKPPESL